MDKLSCIMRLEGLTDNLRITKREVIEQLVIILDTDVSEISRLDQSDWDGYFSPKELRSNERFN